MKRSPLYAYTQPIGELGQSQPVLGFEDLSVGERFGLKGPGAEGWLAAQGWNVPTAPNSGQISRDGTWVARLGMNEFLVELSARTPADALGARDILFSINRPTDVYPVVRQDFVIRIRGSALLELLRQVCSVDFAPLLRTAPLHEELLVLTSMLGVSVVVWPHHCEDESSVLLWLDPSFAHYFWTTLLDVGGGLGTLTLGKTT
jgi:sarcosine oxidase gamma subunit